MSALCKISQQSEITIACTVLYIIIKKEISPLYFFRFCLLFQSISIARVYNMIIVDYIIDMISFIFTFF